MEALSDDPLRTSLAPFLNAFKLSLKVIDMGIWDTLIKYSYEAIWLSIL